MCLHVLIAKVNVLAKLGSWNHVKIIHPNCLPAPTVQSLHTVVACDRGEVIDFLLESKATNGAAIPR